MNVYVLAVVEGYIVVQLGENRKQLIVCLLGILQGDGQTEVMGEQPGGTVISGKTSSEEESKK